MTTRLVALISTLSLALSSAVVAQGPSADWTQWRGPNRDGVAPFAEPQLWPENLTQRWKIEVGPGYATPLVIGDRLYVFARQGDNEVMRTIDAATGMVMWETGYPATFEMHSAAARHGAGPKSTPVFSNGRLFSIGMTGIVTAFDAASGEQLWQKPGSDIVPLYTSHSFSPIIEGDAVIFHVGGHNQGAITAFDAETGDARWSWDGDGPGYGSPVVAALGGTRQLVTITQGKIVGIDVTNGALLWERDYVSPNFTNSMTPVVVGERVIVAGPGPTTAFTVATKNDQWVATDVWANADVPLRMSNAVVVDDTLFGLSTRNSGQYFSVDLASGNTLWTSDERQAGHASIARVGSVVLSLEEDGELIVFRRPGPAAAFESIRRYQVADSQTWTQPSMSGNRIFVKDVTTLALWTLD